MGTKEILLAKYSPEQLKTTPEKSDVLVSSINKTLNVVKSLNVEQRMALFVVLVPETVDLHGDVYSAAEVEKACHNFNLNCGTANVFHKANTDKAQIVQSYIAPVAMTLDNGTVVKKGTWLQLWCFPEGDADSEALWQGVKSGEINGVSIAAKAVVEELK
ncbi:putative phage serine protease XkdF [compost metagenome]